MAEKKKLSVAEMLAAARAGKPAAEKSAEESPAEKPAEAPAEAAAPAAEAAPKPAPAKPAGGKMSVAEMMAAARAQKSAPAAPAAPEPPKAEAPAPAPKAEKPKPAPKEKEAAPVTAEKGTDSILAGGPAKDKPGPITKAEQAAKEGPAAKAKVKPVAPPMPPKPAYAQPKPAAKAGAEVERRGFMVAVGLAFSAMLGSALGVGFTAMSATFGLWGLALARFMFPNVLREPPSKFKVGFISDFPFGKVEEKYKAQYGVWVVNYEYNGQREVYALSTVCTHLGCTPNWLESEQKFKCPCHGSGFYKDGINFEGPAPRPLERYAIKIADDGQLEIDKSRKFQEEMGQWDDPTSYVVT